MPRFIVERKIACAGELSREALLEIARKSKQVISGMDVPYNGVETYVEGDRVCCVHVAESADVIYRRAHEGGFPADLVTEAPPSNGPQTSTGVLSQLRDEFGIRTSACCPADRRSC